MVIGLVVWWSAAHADCGTEVSLTATGDHVAWDRAIAGVERFDPAIVPAGLRAIGPLVYRKPCFVGAVDGALGDEAAGAWVLAVCPRPAHRRLAIVGAIAVDRPECGEHAFAIDGDAFVVAGVRWTWADGALTPAHDTLGTVVIADAHVDSVAGSALRVRTFRHAPGDHPLRVDDHACTDADRDGVCAPNDCDDADPRIHPGAFDDARDGVDQDCDGVVAGDRDGDGHAAVADCDDADPTRWASVTTHLDSDGDGFGDFAYAVCAGEAIVPDGDCLDTDPHVHPGAPERDNLVDDDCDGDVGAWETGRDNARYRVVDAGVVRYAPRMAGDAHPVVGRLDDVDGTRCWVFEVDDGSPWSGKVTWWRTAVVACAEGEAHLRPVAAVPVPGERTDFLREGGHSGSLGRARVDGSGLVVDGRRWSLDHGALVTPRAAPGPGLGVVDDGDALVNRGTSTVDAAGLVVRGPWSCNACWDDDPDVVLHAPIAPGPDGTRPLAPGERLDLDEGAWGHGRTAWFQGGSRTVWAGDTLVAE